MQVHVVHCNADRSLPPLKGPPQRRRVVARRGGLSQTRKTTCLTVCLFPAWRNAPHITLCHINEKAVAHHTSVTSVSGEVLV